MKKVVIVLFSFSILLTTLGQTIDLTFTAVSNESYVKLDSIKILNRTQGGDTLLYWPDTVLSLIYTGINENSLIENSFRVVQNYPNPVVEQTIISLFVPQKDQVNILITDIRGRIVLQAERILDKGKHTFLFTPGSGNLFFFTAQWRGNRNGIKILNTGEHSNGSTTLDYIGIEEYTTPLKEIENIQNFLFNPGDELLYIGYTGAIQSGMLDTPEESDIYILQFTYDVPCPGIPTIEYEGQIYNTVQIMSQCWLKENLNAGTMIPGNQEMSNNGIIEKYCYDNDTLNCEEYGGLYQWDEIMQYTTGQSTQGICPEDWHLPSDEEWKVLEGVMDSQYGIGDTIWDYGGYRGVDAGFNIKSSSGWTGNNNGSDYYGFSVLPGGIRFDTIFNGINVKAQYWTTTSFTNAAYARLISLDDYIFKHVYVFGHSFSIRCIKD